jgi:deoxyribose-phosphate aldolase
MNNDGDSEIRRILPVLTSEEKARIDMIDRGTWEPPEIQSMADLASFIDHTLLTPDATPSEIIALCDEAVKWTTGAVCINPVYVPLAHQTLGSSPTDIAAVAAFPVVGAQLVLSLMTGPPACPPA